MDNMVKEITRRNKLNNLNLTGFGVPSELEKKAGLWVSKAGARAFPNGFSYNPNTNHHAEWGVLLSGQIHIRHNNTTYTVREGNYYFLPPTCKVMVESEELPYIIWFEVYGDGISDFIHMCNFSLEVPEVDIADHAQVRSAFEIAKCLDERPVGFSYLACSQLWRFIANTTGAHEINNRPLSDDIRKVIVAIKENIIGSTYTLEYLAEISGLKVETFRKKFLAEVGDSPIRFLLNQKMERAKSMLTDENISIKDITYQLGFNDPYYFSRLFKKYVGVSPKNYIKIMHRTQ